MFNPTEELLIPTGTPSNKANAEINQQPLTEEKKQENAQSMLKPYTFLCFLINKSCFICSKKYFFAILAFKILMY